MPYPPRAVSLPALEICYDGVIPFPLRDCAAAGGLDIWQSRIARTAERNFHHLILNSLFLLSAWRLHVHPQRSKQLNRHSKLLSLYREKACQAHDLIGK
jgi:hypothetical protein